FPFEEKAIDVHEKNIEMLRTGVYNDWTKKSLEKLTELMPGRYAKPEMSIAFLAEIETYTYRSPASQVSAPTTANADTTPGKPDPTTNSTPQPLDRGTVKPGTSQVSAPTTDNANMTPGKPDQITNPTPQPVDNRSPASQVSAPTTGNTNTTPSK